ncbi:hypothetical protein DFH06DRAFT_1481774 [Mycena polygramma]|nr:hypothetical protein DFH06DRAFT_1481774 [Mycena polygramma]
MLTALEADRVRVAELQTQILDLERTLTGLRFEQSKPQRRLDAYKYPVTTLPNEIVSEIFMHVMPPYPKSPPLTGPSSPTFLAQICRQWRKLALDLCPLWRVISLDGSGFEWETRMVRLWLDRSRCCPLDIRLGKKLTRDHDARAEAVASHRTRWEFLKYDLGFADLQVPIFDGPMPVLRHFELRVDDNLPDPIVVDEAPLLRGVVLNLLNVSQAILPWTQLTSLTLLRVFPSGCVPILVQTLNLVHCRLSVCFEDRNAESRPDITLPSLESLALRNYTSAFPMTDFLPSFIVPALRSLDIPEDCLQRNPIDSLTAFVSRSECRLEKLHVIGVTSVPESSYGQAFPSLRKLSFGEDIETDDEDSELDDPSADDSD